MPLYSFSSSYFILVAWEANVKCSSVGEAKVAAPHSLSGVVVCLVESC